jgi:hypothetical protein
VVQPLLFHRPGQPAGGGLPRHRLAAGGAAADRLLLTLFRALERWRPVEPLTDRAAVRTDMIYTLIHRLGLFRLALFFTLDRCGTC